MELPFDHLLDNFLIIFGNLFDHLGSEKQYKADREAMLCISEKRFETLDFAIKMKDRRRRGCIKNKRKHQPDTPKIHSQRFATTVIDF